MDISVVLEMILCLILWFCKDCCLAVLEQIYAFHNFIAV